MYLAKWPEYCLTAEGPGRGVLGYILGKAEGDGKNWHGHVTALTVAPDYRRQGLAEKLMNLLEDVTEKVHDGYFVDLFVRVSNQMAITMYNKFGYSVYRRVIGYYSGDEDAYGECVLPPFRAIPFHLEPAHPSRLLPGQPLPSPPPPCPALPCPSVPCPPHRGEGGGSPCVVGVAGSSTDSQLASQST